MTERRFIVALVLLGLMAVGVFGFAVVVVFNDPPTAEPPKPTTEIDMAKRDHDIAACRVRGLTPVMGFGWAVVCVEEK